MRQLSRVTLLQTAGYSQSLACSATADGGPLAEPISSVLQVSRQDVADQQPISVYERAMCCGDTQATLKRHGVARLADTTLASSIVKLKRLRCGPN